MFLHVNCLAVVDVIKIGSGLDILYPEADNLGVTVNSFVSVSK